VSASKDKKVPKPNVHSVCGSLTVDRYRPALNPTEFQSLPENYQDTIVAEVFRERFLNPITSARRDANADWPFEWFVAVEQELGIYRKDKSLLHMVPGDENGAPCPDEATIRLLGDAYRHAMFGVINPFDIPDDYSEQKPWDIDDPGDGVLLIDSWTYPMVEMFLDLPAGRGKTADSPMIGYQLWVGYEASISGDIAVAPVLEKGDTFTEEDMVHLPAVDVIVALFGPQKPKGRRPKFAPSKPPSYGKYDLYQLHRVQVAADELEADVAEPIQAIQRLNAECYSVLGQSEDAVRINDAAAWIVEREDARKRRWNQKNVAPVTFIPAPAPEETAAE
jgi:hypothetical protein